MEGKLATIWRDEKAPHLGRSSDMQTVRREKIHVRSTGREVGKYCVFRGFVAPDGRKAGSCEDTSGNTYVMIRGEMKFQVNSTI